MGIIEEILWGAPKAAAEIAAEVVGKSAGAVLGTAKVVGQATQAVAQAAFDLGTKVDRGAGEVLAGASATALHLAGTLADGT